jgi:hypothetical protein
MARTVTEIHKGLLDMVQADAVLSVVLTSTSSTAVFRLILYIAAYCAFSVEMIYDFFRIEMDDKLAREKAHRGRWYVEMAKKFQYGFNLFGDEDYYDNTGIPDAVVAASKVIAFAAYTENPKARLKVAMLQGDDLIKVPEPIRLALVAYIGTIKDAGVKLKNDTITSGDPDKLRITLRVKFNALVLNNNGERIDGSNNTLVKEAIKKYIQKIDFDGLFSVKKMEDSIQAVDGVVDFKIDSIQTKYGATNFTNVDIDFVPDAGFLIIEDADLNISYLPE